MQAPSKTPADSFDEICSIRIELVDTDPVIWREVEVPTSITLKVLHDIVQAAMGWFDCHLWQSTIEGRRYRVPFADGGDDEPAADPGKTRLRDVLNPRRTRIAYLYDFGDSWEHVLTVTRVRAGEPGASYPQYIGGEWNGPPENCGGIPGFYRMMEALADAGHPDHGEVTEWLDDYDPKVIDEAPIRIALGRIAKRRNTARTRLATKPA